MRAIKNVRIYDYCDFIENGYLIYDTKILEVGNMDSFKFKGEVFDGQGKLLIPGLINGHTHIYSTLIRGLSLPFSPINFQDILDQIWWKFDTQLDLESIEASAFIYGIESLKSGVTTIIDHHASGLDIAGSLNMLRKVITEVLHLRGLFCFETSDRFTLKTCIDENLNSGDYMGLHASSSLSEESLTEISQHLEQPIHIHVAESIDDQQDSLGKYGKRIISRLNEHQLLKKDSILAHCLHIEQDEAKLIFDQECLIAINPTSNLNNCVGSFNYQLLKDNKIQILIGTDGLGCNIAKEWQNFYYLNKQGLGNPAGITLDEIKDYLAASYKYLSRQLQIKIGEIKEDFVADFLLLDYQSPTPLNTDNIFGHLFYGCFENFKPTAVWVKGRQLVRDYQTIFDEQDIFAESVTISNKLWNRVKS